ncbi:methylcrotonoyl-CoA carboxylase [Sandarakinorhabdus cyanobacteriorum]|uniref:Methylcrotonoyl-CoA carboxylase n=1 Tax=Sandarakinorhabdus cyanobacteriorum TaxID=1981098 RepID=A0A255Y4X5_9SPHN|nr:biotin carboxylase N-terminal domain-containing protein [Sandarakinorhabdus cyanobacteriorum]OYQ24302.1 methylcrotonoyl-CoA carboxylase [Sandarakinorhabdus cyanobacteriorum]
MHKILIANRGEIACRIIRTAHRLGLATVAVHSAADADAPFVREAGQAVPLAGDRPYLDIDAIIAAARRTGADAIHPGYGFLSENAEFAKALKKAGLIFIGPPESAMRVMALKDTAKAAMKKAGVPITPGYQGTDQSLVRLQKAAEGVGFPLLIKAVAGGGGKGMRAVHAPEEFQDALMAAQREGETAFGNPAVMLEKLIQRPRHVEVQLFADAHGNAVHLFERDCSLQRRHQKVIEEAPAPGLSDRLRHTLGIAAVTAAHAIGYQGAGTVEFILDLDTLDEAGDPAFYFMEMNTRLQVEHPVTECITGEDLVEWQIRVARGEPLPKRQDELSVTGWAMEARLYAEDPDGGFLPSTGTIHRLAFGAGAGVRIDTGVEQGSRIGLDYDPMIAKVIAHGASRGEAIDRLVGALDATIVDGLKSNRAFLARLADHPAFRAGEVDTGFIARHMASLSPPAACPAPALLAAALGLGLPSGAAPASLFAALPIRLNLAREQTVMLSWQGDAHAVSLRSVGQDRWRIGGLPGVGEVSARRTGPNGLMIDMGGTLLPATMVPQAGSVEVRLAGQSWSIATMPPKKAEAGAGHAQLMAPMPGRVLSVDVTPGQAVAEGDRLLVLEAMKMEHRLTARTAGTIKAVHVATGDQVADGMMLVEFA